MVYIHTYIPAYLPTYLPIATDLPTYLRMYIYICIYIYILHNTHKYITFSPRSVEVERRFCSSTNLQVPTQQHVRFHASGEQSQQIRPRNVC